MKSEKLVANGKSQYVILVPEKTDVYIDFAVKTLVGAIKESTGVQLDVVNNATENFISLGNTCALKKLNPEIKYGRDGYCVIEKDGNLYLFGQSEYGPIWATYDFLERTVGYKFYTIEDIIIEKRSEIDISGLNVCYTPTFSNRTSGFGLCRTNLEYATGLKAYAYYGQKLDGKFFWGSWVHNHVQVFLPPKKYYKDHPEWYVQEERYKTEDVEKMRPDRMQLCLSNMEMRDEFAKNLIETIKGRPDSSYFVIGHEDNYIFCDCENCKKVIEKIGTSGLHMQFLNDMARRVEEWRQQNAPEREMITVCGLAYELDTTFPPPVKFEKGEYVPVDPSVVAEKNLLMIFAPMSTPEHSRSVLYEKNRNLLDILNKWKKVCHRYGAYTYYGSFRRAFEFVDGFTRLKEDIEFFKDLGVEYYFVESPSRKGAISLQAMTLYVLTQLEWNKDLDPDELRKEFCEVYYKAASPFIEKYYQYLMDYYAKTRKRIEYLTGKDYCYGMCFTDTVPQGFWELNAVYDAWLILEDADKAIDEFGYNDPALIEKLHDRIELERMTLLYIQLEYFNKDMCNYDELRTINTFPKEKVLELCDRFERDVKKFELKFINGDGTPDEIIQNWRNRAVNTHRFWEERIYKLRENFNKVR